VSGYRIAVASSGVAHVKRGIETWAVDLTRALRDRGMDACLFQGSGEANEHRVTVPCMPRGSKWNERLARQAPGFFWRLGMKSPYEIEQTTFALRLLLSRGAHGFDILHTQDPHLARILDTFHRRGLFPPRVLLAHGTEEPPEYLAGFSYLQHLAPQHAEEIATFQKPGTKWFVGPTSSTRHASIRVRTRPCAASWAYRDRCLRRYHQRRSQAPPQAYRLPDRGVCPL
jgi:hypothetical protein